MLGAVHGALVVVAGFGAGVAWRCGVVYLAVEDGCLVACGFDMLEDGVLVYEAGVDELLETLGCVLVVEYDDEVLAGEDGLEDLLCGYPAVTMSSSAAINRILFISFEF